LFPPVRLAAGVLFSFYFRGRVIQTTQFPRRGPAIIVANHASTLDGVLIHAVCRRPLRVLVAAEWVEWWLLRFVFRSIGAIPVDRERRNPNALEGAIAALESGDSVALFPEGGIQEGGVLGAFRHGASRLALRTGAPVFPCAIVGSLEALPWPRIVPRRARITVRCGEPVQFPAIPEGRIPADALASATAQIRAAVAELLALGHARSSP